MIRIIKSEYFRSIRYSPVRYFLILGLIIPLIADFSMVEVELETFKTNMGYAKESSHFIYFSNRLFIFFMFLTPLMTTMISLMNIIQEKDADGWKYYFVMPVKIWKIFLAKFLFTWFQITLYVLFALLTHYLGTIIINSLRPELEILPARKELILCLIILMKVSFSGMAILPIIWIISFISRAYFLLLVMASIFLLFIPTSFNPYTTAMSIWDEVSTIRASSSLSHINSLKSYLFYKTDLTVLAFFGIGCSFILIFNNILKQKIYVG